ncbi:hypothetical protein HPULCUR_000807 [Helicostylum pulchrum]|uniref:Bromo domain-containing protein n=1 Tax=Helicostylum pulchrum TaxID=562976 RepID=A0ABP9XKX4_9FUNG
MNIVSRTNSPSPSIPPGSKTNMTRDQVKYCGAIMRNLKKHRDATPFLHPVDYIKLNVPDYPKVIKYPMDLTTVDQKLNNGEYENSTPPPRSMSPSLFDQDEGEKVKKRKKQAINNNKSVPITHNSHVNTHITSPQHNGRRISEDGRPKREIHPPPSKDYPEPMTKRRNPRKNDLQMKFCQQTLRELKKSKYRDINYPFLQPVDVVALNIPDYVDIVKHPMDLATIERKLAEGDYEEPEQFEQDIRLMFNNCYLYNPPTLPVHKMGRELEKAFDEKWAQRPSTPVSNPVIDEHVEEFEEAVQEEEEEEEEEEESDQDGKFFFSL